MSVRLLFLITVVFCVAVSLSAGPNGVQCDCQEVWKGPSDYYAGMKECTHGGEYDQDCKNYAMEQWEQLKMQFPNVDENVLFNQNIGRWLLEACMETNGGNQVLVNGMLVSCNCFDCNAPQMSECLEYTERYGARCPSGQGDTCTTHPSPVDRPTIRKTRMAPTEEGPCTWNSSTNNGISPEPGCDLSDVAIVACLTTKCQPIFGTTEEISGRPPLCGPPGTAP